MSQMFNEDSRVKIPAILHSTCLGYKNLSLKNPYWDKDNNVFTPVFKESLLKINPNASKNDAGILFGEIKPLLDHEGLGKAFSSQSATSLTDFKNLNNNSFSVDLYQADQDAIKKDFYE